MKLSIIIPIYNTANTLKRCVHSILQTAADDIELLLVDDGTPDNGGKIADEMARNDARITVIHKTNGGLSDARNSALDRMTGDYVTFADSDDEILPGSLHCLMQRLAEMPDIDILEYPVTERQGCSNEHVFMPDERVYDSAWLWLAERGLEHCWVWNKVFKASLFKDIRFEKGKKYEDVYLIGELMKLCPTVATTRRGMYIYHWNADGITAERNMILLLEAQMHIVQQLDIDTSAKEWHRLYLNMFTTQLHAYRESGRILLPTQRIGIRKYRGASDIIKALLLDIFGVRMACRLFKLLK